MSPQFIVLLVLAVVVVIGAGIYFQQRERTPGDEAPKGPDSTDSNSHDGEESESGRGDGGGCTFRVASATVLWIIRADDYVSARQAD